MRILHDIIFQTNYLSTDFHSIFLLFLVTSLPSKKKTCNFYQKLFANRQDLHRYSRNINKVGTVNLQLKKCTQCEFICSSLNLMKKIVQKTYSTEQAKFCLSCNNFFPSLRQFSEHRKVVCSLPSVSSSQNVCEIQSNNSALNGTVESLFPLSMTYLISDKSWSK